MKHGSIKGIVLLILCFIGPYFVNAATGDILYQNCAGGGSCTGAGSNKGWVRTVETNGCYSGSCLKLVATSNPLPNGSVRYGAGNTSINTQSVSGKREVTVSFWIKFNEDSTAISGGNIKNIIPYLKNEVRYGTIISDAPVRDYYVGSLVGTFRPASWLWVLTNATNAAYAVPKGDGTYFADNYTAFEFKSKAPPGRTWKKFTVYIKTPSTPTARDGIYRIWYENELMLDFFNVGPKNIPSISELQRISFYPSSEAGEPFEHWMDEMIIYEGYVPPSGDSTPPPNPTPDPTPGGTTVCHKLNSSSPVMSGFGAAYDPYSPSTLLMKTLCNDSSVYIEIGDNKNTRYIYRYGYILKNNSWQRLDLLPFSSTNTRNGDWIIGKAKATYPLTSTELTKDNYVLSYTCDLINSQWKCGCRDTACTTSYWQLQWFKRE